MMQNQGNRTRIFDFFLLLSIFFSVVGIAQRVGAFRADAGETLTEFPVEILWENADAQTVDCIAKGEVIRTENEEAFGTVTEIRRAPHESVLYNEGREIRKVLPAGTTEDVRLTVAVLARRADGILFRADGTAILVGQNLHLYSMRATLSATVFSA